MPELRTSILLAGPLVARHGEAIIYPPGGDVIGRRRLDTHFHGLNALGVDIKIDESYHFKSSSLKGTEILLDEASVTATENVLMAATLAAGKTIIYNAACEPHVQDLSHLLNAMGASIKGGTNRIEVDGVESLHGAEHYVQPDYIEIRSFITAAVVTGGNLVIPNAGDRKILNIMQRTYARLGVQWEIDDKGTLNLHSQTDRFIQGDIGNETPEIEDGIWPAFPSDLMSVAIVLATQTKSTTLFLRKCSRVECILLTTL